MNRPLAANLLLAFLAVSLPIAVLELTLRQLTRLPARANRAVTDLYVRDAVLGWRLEPGTEGVDIGGRRVRVNEKGLRGPALPYTKPEGVRRILYLGDSVTFGWKLDYYDTFPYRAEEWLEAPGGLEVETVNAGVSGYSPWQEHLYLVREGIRYDPDLVVLSFVLNDVVEKFRLMRFGGDNEGFQLALATRSWLQELISSSALLNGMRRLYVRLRFGSDVAAGAKELEDIQVDHLVTRSEDPDVRDAWEVTLERVDRMVRFCRERDIPIAIVVFPYAFQFEDPPAMSAPQRVVVAYARERGVPVLDLLPPLAEQLQREGAEPGRYFFDTNHLSPMGSRVVGRLVGDFLRTQGLLETSS